MAKKKTTRGLSRPESGGARLIRSGRTAVLLGLTPDEVELIDRARDLAPRTRFIVRAAIEEAKRILEGGRR